MTDKDHDKDHTGENRSVVERRAAEAAVAPAVVEPVFEGRSGALATALRTRNINVVAAEDVGDDGVKLTVDTPQGPQVYELEGRDATFDVALAILGGKP